MGAAPDLNNQVTFGGIELNTVSRRIVTAGQQPVISGCTVDWMDVTEIEVRQFTEPLALQDGIDVGGVWRGARRISMRGTVYDETRGLTYDRLAALEAAMEFASGTFGYSSLLWYTTDASNAQIPNTIDVRPHGLRYTIVRDEHGGEADQPLAIRWAVTFYAKDPRIT